jgi:hypothetical protein
MQAERVDPRDEAWEVKTPRYRCYYWTPLNGDGAWKSDEWQIDAADVTELILWAEENSAGRDFVLYGVIPADGARVGLVKLYGSDPTER